MCTTRVALDPGFESLEPGGDQHPPECVVNGSY